MSREQKTKSINSSQNFSRKLLTPFKYYLLLALHKLKTVYKKDLKYGEKRKSNAEKRVKKAIQIQQNNKLDELQISVQQNW